MWSDTVCLRTRPVSDQKKIGLGPVLAGLVLCCETRSCYARRHNDLEGHSNVPPPQKKNKINLTAGARAIWKIIEVPGDDD